MIRRPEPRPAVPTGTDRHDRNDPLPLAGRRRPCCAPRGTRPSTTRTPRKVLPMRNVKLILLTACLLGAAAALTASFALRSAAAPQTVVAPTEEAVAATQLPLTHVHLFAN